MSTKRLKWSILVVPVVLYVVLPFCLFPGEKDYRKTIRQAKTVELQYLPAPNYETTYFTMATVCGSDDALLRKLSQSIELQGVWTLFTHMSGNVYRIRAIEQDGSWRDIAVLGEDKIKHGNWAISISPKAVKTIKEVVIESGGQLPNKEILLELLGHATQPEQPEAAPAGE